MSPYGPYIVIQERHPKAAFMIKAPRKGCAARRRQMVRLRVHPRKTEVIAYEDASMSCAPWQFFGGLRLQGFVHGV